MSKEKIINIRVESDVKKQAKQLAENDGRSLSNWVLRLIEAEIRKKREVPSRK
jgi:antitoxin component of RelBE/YafQ-DinJ toxin-antitoxin module